MPENIPKNSIYKQLGAEMRHSLKNIWLKAAQAGNGERTAEAIFEEASGQLSEVIKTTEAAAMEIMEIVERQESQCQEAEHIIGQLQKDDPNPKLDKLAMLNKGVQEDLLTLITKLSFQDITGQRIKKVMTALRELEAGVLELYLASGLMMDAAEKDPEQNAETLAANAREAVKEFKETKVAGSELKGPDSNAPTQAAIDDMLAQLGL